MTPIVNPPKVETLAREYYDRFIGGSNTSNEITVANSPSYVNLFSVKNQFTSDVRVLGIQTRYRKELENCNIVFKDGNGNEILAGDPQLTNIGNSRDSAVGFNTDILPVNFIITTGNEISVYVKNKSEPVRVNDISVLFCVKVLKK